MILRSDIVAQARAWLDTPYVHQASLQGVGCDCLGLVRGVWGGVIGDEPEEPPAYSRDWAEATGEEAMAEAARAHLVAIDVSAFAPGDVLLFRYRDRFPAKHCAIVASATTMIHAHDGAAVAEVAIAPWWRRRLAFAFQFPGVTD